MKRHSAPGNHAYSNPISQKARANVALAGIIPRYVYAATTMVWGRVLVVTAVFLLALAFNLSPALRGPDEWRWAYALPARPFRHALPLLVVLLYAAGVSAWLRQYARLSQTRRRLGLLLIALSIPFIQLAFLWPESPDVWQQLFFRTVSPGASGVFTVGSQIDSLSSFLSHYPALMPTFPVHPQRYPPGLAVSFYLARQPLAAWPALADQIATPLRASQCLDFNLMRLSNATLATAVWQMALPFIMGSIIWPLFALARRTVGETAALWSAVLYPLIPSFVLWSGRWDQFYPLLALLVWAALAVGIMEQRRGWLLAAGLLLALALFFSFGLLVLLLPMGVGAALVGAKRPFAPVASGVGRRPCLCRRAAAALAALSGVAGHRLLANLAGIDGVSPGPGPQLLDLALLPFV